ncbi:hypothetical protein MKW94_030206 [Papaver nudicaule]|uniref:Uncharacterized protein n=1 Tax=Papaver nudicaule TaxID=74823 RepID=A0AA41W0Q6_PAPNU|nr:hypothetical protein [Papaver nudicaule]
MEIFFSQVFRLLCMILLLSQVAWSRRASPPFLTPPVNPPKGRNADRPRPPPPGLLKGPPSGRP